MQAKFSKEEIKFMMRMLGTDNMDDKLLAKGILTKMKYINERRQANIERTSANILEKRKEDKWYGRSKQDVQNHFNALARKIRAYLDARDTYKAKLTHSLMVDDAKLPRYEVQYEDAIKEFLTEEEIKYLKSEVIPNDN